MAERHERDLSTLEVVVMPGPPPRAVNAALPAKVAAAHSSKDGQQTIDWFGQYIEAGATGFVLGLAGRTLDECMDVLERTAVRRHPRIGVTRHRIVSETSMPSARSRRACSSALGETMRPSAATTRHQFGVPGFAARNAPTLRARPG